MEFKNILIVKLSAIGDVVHALPVAQALKYCHPQAKITWVVEKAAYELLENNPCIDELILFDKPGFKSATGLLRNAPEFVSLLRSRKFDLALDLQGLLKSALITFLSGAPVRLVYENAREGSHLFSKRVIGRCSNRHVVDRYLDVVRYLGCSVKEAVFPVYITEREQQSAKLVASHAGLAMNRRYVVFGLGANWPNKIWPGEHFAKLADALYNHEIIPVMIGSKGDTILAEQVTAAASIPPVDLTGRTGLKQLAYIIQQAAAFVGGDTGPMHLAAALNTPVVALMGPTDIIRNGPYGQAQTALIAPRECAGCWQRVCPQGLDCLKAIEPQAVNQVLQKVLNER